MSLGKWRPRPDTRSGNGYAAMQRLEQGHRTIPSAPGLDPPLTKSERGTLKNCARERLTRPRQQPRPLGDRPDPTPQTCTPVRCSGPGLGRLPISGPRDLTVLPVLARSAGIHAAALRAGARPRRRALQ